MKFKIDLTYFDFLDDVKKFPDRGVTDVNEIMSEFIPGSNLNDIYPAELLFLADYVKHSFLLISNSNSFLGYTKHYLMDAGLSDNSNFKKNSAIVSIIEKVMGWQKLTKIQVNTFSFDEQEYPISKREINVLRCICDGMSSK